MSRCVPYYYARALWLVDAMLGARTDCSAKLWGWFVVWSVRRYGS